VPEGTAHDLPAAIAAVPLTGEPASEILVAGPGAGAGAAAAAYVAAARSARREAHAGLRLAG
jgi:hypothetical protein